MRQTRSYDAEYKVQAVKLAKTRGTKAAAAEPGIPERTLGGWVHKAKSRLNELNEFLEEASAFFAASRRKSGRGND